MTKVKTKVYRGGRGVTLYKPEFDELAHDYCLIGATNADLARFFEVTETTIIQWGKKYPGFRQAIRAGKEIADMNVVKSLYKRAIGYTCHEVVSLAANVPADKINMEDMENGTFSPDNSNGFQTIKVTTREVIPDTRAQIFWLKNRQPKHWREKHEVDHKTDGEKMSYVKIFELPNDGRND